MIKFRTSNRAFFLFSKNRRIEGEINMSGFSLEHLDVVRFYLFGDVKFLHLLLVLMVLDVITGIIVLILSGLAEKLKVVES